MLEGVRGFDDNFLWFWHTGKIRSEGSWYLQSSGTTRSRLTELATFWKELAFVQFFMAGPEDVQQMQARGHHHRRQHQAQRQCQTFLLSRYRLRLPGWTHTLMCRIIDLITVYIAEI